MKRLIRNEVARCQPASLRKKLFHMSSFKYFAFIFYKRTSRFFLLKRLWKCASKIYFRKYKQKVALVVIYLFSYDSSKSTSFMLNMAFDCLENGFCQVNWNLSQYKDYINNLLFSACVLWYEVFFDKRLIVLHHGDNTFLYYFDNCIKLKLSAIILAMEKWQHFTWCLNYITLDKTCYTTKPFSYSKIQ